MKYKIPEKLKEQLMRFQLRKSKTTMGIFLMAQSSVLFLLFAISWNKSKGVAKALGLLAALESAGGAFLILSELYDKKMIQKMNRQFDDFDEEFDEEFANEE